MHLESGVSNDKCSDIYPGPKAFSEIETLNIKNFLETLDPVPILGISFFVQRLAKTTFELYIKLSCVKPNFTL